MEFETPGDLQYRCSKDWSPNHDPVDWAGDGDHLGFGTIIYWTGTTGATLVNGAGCSLLNLLWAICNSPRLHRCWTLTTNLLLAWCPCNSPAKLCYPLDAHGPRNGAGQILRQRLAIPANYADWAQSMVGYLGMHTRLIPTMIQFWTG